jgi:DUF4097 and DUF4098 domain-containing protein YvlB
MAVAMLIGVAAVNAFGQETATKDKLRQKERSFCTGDNWSNDDRVSFRDLREMTIPATGSLTVDAGRNGGIHVIGSDRNDTVVRACVQTWGTTDEAAKAAASGIRISTSGTIKADGADDKNMSVSFQVLVPRSTSVNLSAKNGGISVSGTDGTTEFETVNGGVNLVDLSGNVKGSTINGGVHVVLAGSSWRGSGLDVTTTNGGVHISMPSNYAAHLEASTVNGGFHSDIPALNVTTEDKRGDWHSRTRRIDMNLNGGGAPIKVTTSNGGVHVDSGSNATKY